MAFVDLDENQLDALLEFERNNWTWLQGENGRKLDQPTLGRLYKMGLIEHKDDTSYAYYFQRGGKKRYYITQGGLIAMWEYHGSKGEFPNVGKVGAVWILEGGPPIPVDDTEATMPVREETEAEAGARTRRLALKEERRLKEQAIRTLKYQNKMGYQNKAKTGESHD